MIFRSCTISVDRYSSGQVTHLGTKTISFDPPLLFTLHWTYLNTNINILVADAVWASNYWAKRRKEEKNLERVSSSVRTNSSEDQHHNNHDKSFHYYNILYYWRSKRQLEWQGALSCSHFSFQHTVRVLATITDDTQWCNKNQQICGFKEKI